MPSTPPLSERAPQIFTPEYYARLRELEATSWWNEGVRDIAEMLLHRSRIPDTGVLLDAGCGSGQTMSWFLGQHPRWTTIGLDVATDGLQAGRGDLLLVCCASTLQLPLADKTVDLVVSLDALQHLPLDGGDAIALAEFFRVMRPGGTLLVRTRPIVPTYSGRQGVFLSQIRAGRIAEPAH